MKTRDLRRWHTECHQSRQVKIDSYYNSVQDALSRKKYYRKRNALNCGRPRCCFCMNKRRNPWHSTNERLTLSELRCYDSFRDQMEDFYNVHEISEH